MTGFFATNAWVDRVVMLHLDKCVEIGMVRLWQALAMDTSAMLRGTISAIDEGRENVRQPLGVVHMRVFS